MSESSFRPRRRRPRKAKPSEQIGLKNNQATKLDLWLGLDHPDVFDRTIRIAFGVVTPMLILWSAISGYVTGETMIIGRGGRLNLSGWAASWASTGYLCLGLLIHVQMIWMTHRWLAGVAEVTRYMLVLLIGVSMLGVVWGVLL